VLGELVPVPLCSQQIHTNTALGLKSAFTVRLQRLTVGPMSKPTVNTVLININPFHAKNKIPRLEALTICC